MNFNKSNLIEIKNFKKYILKKFILNTEELNLKEIEKNILESQYVHPAIYSILISDSINLKSHNHNIILNELRKISKCKSPFFNLVVGYKKDKNVFKAFRWEKYSLKRQSIQLKNDSIKNYKLDLIRKNNENREVVLKNAYNLIEKTWLDRALEIKELVTHVIWFKAEKYWSSTDPSAFGAIFINPQKNWHLLNYVETLLHEAGHLQLMIKETMSPLLLNPKERVTSPIRSDPRPMKGVLHATYVLAQMSEGLLKVANLNDENSSIALIMAKNNLNKLENGIITLREFAEFTFSGMKLFKEIELKYNELKSELIVNANEISSIENLNCIA